MRQITYIKTHLTLACITGHISFSAICVLRQILGNSGRLSHLSSLRCAQYMYTSAARWLPFVPRWCSQSVQRGRAVPVHSETMRPERPPHRSRLQPKPTPIGRKTTTRASPNIQTSPAHMHTHAHTQLRSHTATQLRTRTHTPPLLPPPQLTVIYLGLEVARKRPVGSVQEACRPQVRLDLVAAQTHWSICTTFSGLM